jgi:hypothetical protein
VRAGRPAAAARSAAWRRRSLRTSRRSYATPIHRVRPSMRSLAGEL